MMSSHQKALYQAIKPYFSFVGRGTRGDWWCAGLFAYGIATIVIKSIDVLTLTTPPAIHYILTL